MASLTPEQAMEVFAEAKREWDRRRPLLQDLANKAFPKDGPLVTERDSDVVTFSNRGHVMVSVCRHAGQCDAMEAALKAIIAYNEAHPAP